METTVKNDSKSGSKPTDATAPSNGNHHAATINKDKFDAVLFDMDGVVTRTATVHFAAWKKTFDEFLKQREGDKFKEFTQQDYLQYVDGMPREDGVRTFMKSRQIELPEKSSGKEPSVESIAKAKDAEFVHQLHTNGVEAYETTVVLIRELKSAGIKVALVTASKNGAEVLEVANLTHLFDATVTGVDAAKQNLKGKPAPDVFLEAAKRLDAKPERAIVVEDAEAGVESGKNGHFGMVIGVARENNVDSLKKHGATVVVRDLAEIDVAHGNEKGEHGTAFSDLNVTEANFVVEYDHYDPAHEMQRESLCALGNGKFCTRGAEPESVNGDTHYPGTYVSGGYNPAVFSADDITIEREELVNLPNWLFLTFKSNDSQWFDLDKVEVLAYSKRLNLREGMLYRDVHFKDPDGRETKLRERRFVHMRYSHLAGLQVEITPVNWSGKLTVRSAIDGNVMNAGDTIDPRFKVTNHLDKVHSTIDGEVASLKVLTTVTKLAVAEAIRTRVFRDGEPLEVAREPVEQERLVGQDLSFDAQQGHAIVVDKIASLFTSRDKGVYEAGLTCLEAVDEAKDFNDLVQCHTGAWRSLWQQFDLFIETTDEYSKLVPSLLLHLNSFHTLQTASMHTVDLDCGIPARGWTGEGYQGHVFWDDLFVFPFINLRMPNISAALLKYRYRRLGEARKIAKSRGAKGACFPWQSATDGKERTPGYWWLAPKEKWIRDYTHLELHVNGAIAYNVWLYFLVTFDTGFMRSYGSEIILEIARFFASIAEFSEEKQRYEIKKVIGPDEFHNGYPNFKEPGVDNNSYTNILAVWTINRALQVLEKIPSDHREHIMRRLYLEEDELDAWRDVAKRMYLPIMKNGILAQFDGYEELEEFPGMKDGVIDQIALTNAFNDNDGYLNQYKISKQSDVLMLGYLFREETLRELVEGLGYPGDCVDFERLAEYYVPRTSNQSTLSRVAIAWILSRISRRTADKLLETQEKYGDGDGIFFEALGSDYFDVASRGTTKYGIHMGAMAGTVDIVQRCYTGLMIKEDFLCIDPALPKELVRLSFNFNYRGQSLSFDLNHDRVKISAKHSIAEPVKLSFRSHEFDLEAGETREFEISSG